MKVLSNKPLNIKNASLAMLTPIQQVNALPDKVVVFDTFDGIGLENYFNIQGAVLLLVKHGSCSIELDLKKYTITDHSCVVALPNQIVRISEISPDIKFVCVACSLAMVEDLMIHINEAISFLIKATTYLKIRFLRIRNYFAIVQFFDCKTQEQHPKPIQFSNHPKHATSLCIRVYRQPYKIRQKRTTFLQKRSLVQHIHQSGCKKSQTTTQRHLLRDKTVHHA